MRPKLARYMTFRCLTIVIFLFILFQIIFIYIFSNFITSENNVLKSVIISSEQQNQTIFSFGFPNDNACNVADKQAISALKRMKTDRCRQQCIETYCSLSGQKSWADKLVSKCPHFSIDRVGKLDGCYQFNDTLLNSKSKKKSSIFLRDNQTDCIGSCLQYDFEYAGNYLQHCVCLNLDTLTHLDRLSCDQCAAQHEIERCLIAYRTGHTKMPYYFPTEYENQIYEFRPKIVFLLLVNGRSVLQVHRLLRNIYSTYHFYYIHVDLRHNYLHHQLLILENKFENIRLARNRFASIWGGSSLLSTILICFRDIFHVPRWNDWDFIINLSETDFPIKPITNLEKYLSVNKEKNFVKSHGKNTQDFIQMQALNKVFVECEQHMWRIANRELINGIVWDGGSDWFILSRNFTHFVTFDSGELVDSLKNYFKYALLPAESFFHVLLRNSDFCDTIVNNNLRVTNWKRSKGCKCQHKNIVDWCGCSPNTFRNKDASRLVITKRRPLFFARKFEHVIDSDIIDFVEQSLLMNGLPLLDESEYLQSMFNVEYDHPSSISASKRELYSNFRQNLTTFFAQNCHLKNSNLHLTVETMHLNFKESSIYFKNNQFFGIHLRYDAVESNNSAVVELEVIMREFSNVTFIRDTSTRPKLKSLKVCTGFDVKEDVFRDFECHIDQISKIQVFHEWELFFGQHNVSFVFLNPDDRMVFNQLITISNTKTDEQFIGQLLRPSLRYPLQAGLWKVVALNQLHVMGVSKFMVAPTIEATMVQKTTNNRTNDHNLSLDIYSKAILTSFMQENRIFFNSSNQQFWHIFEVCFNPIGTSNTVEVQCDHDAAMKHCHETTWYSRNIRSRYFL